MSNTPTEPAPPTPQDCALAEENLSAARLIIRARTPYFLPAILSMVFVEEPRVPTIGTTSRLRVAYNPAYIAKQDVEQTAGLLVHETLHVWHEHFDPVRAEGRDPARVNRAQDRAINPSVAEAGFKLPPDGCWPKDVGLKDGLAWEEYYEKDQDGDSKGGCAAGSCGGCASNPGEDEPKDGDGPEASGADAGRTKAEVARIYKEVAEGIQDAVDKNQGRIPGAWKKHANATLKPARVRWEDRLAYAVRAAVAYRDGATTHRYDRPSRRQSGLGFGEGVPVLPRLREEVPDVLVGLDTSGSMGGEETSQALDEVQGILNAVGGDVRFGVCDAEMHGAFQPVASAREALSMLKGGGGTNFNPFFEAATAARPQPSVVIFLTDGGGPAPAAPPPYPVVWVYVGPYVARAAVWGQHVRVPFTEGEDVSVIEDGGSDEP